MIGFFSLFHCLLDVSLPLCFLVFLSVSFLFPSCLLSVLISFDRVEYLFCSAFVCFVSWQTFSSFNLWSFDVELWQLIDRSVHWRIIRERDRKRSIITTNIKQISDRSVFQQSLKSDKERELEWNKEKRMVKRAKKRKTEGLKERKRETEKQRKRETEKQRNGETEKQRNRERVKER